MASMFMMKQMSNSILRVTFGSKAQLLFPQLHRCSPNFPSNHVSRVPFTSASKFHQNQYPKEDVGGDEDGKAAERMRQVRQIYEDDREDDEIEMRYEETKQRAKDMAQDINANVKEGAHQAGDAMHDAKERVKDSAHRAGETMHDAKERTKDTMGWTADKTKEGAGKAAEAMHNAGEKAKETVKGAWESVKDGTQKIKETVVGEDEDKYKTKPEDYMEDHLPKRTFDTSRDKDQTMHRSGP